MKWTSMIDWRIFIISLAVGLFFVYMVEPDYKPVYVFPTPDNVGQVQYVDKADTCFDFSVKEVPCQGNGEKNDVQYPVQ